jgi:hypothetical protein
MRISSDHLNIERWQNRSHRRDGRTWFLRDLRLCGCTMICFRLAQGMRLIRVPSARRSGRGRRRRFRLILNQLLVWKPEIAIMVKDSDQRHYQQDESGNHQALLFYGIRLERRAWQQTRNRGNLLAVGHNDPD